MRAKNSAKVHRKVHPKVHPQKSKSAPKGAPKGAPKSARKVHRKVHRIITASYCIVASYLMNSKTSATISRGSSREILVSRELESRGNRESRALSCNFFFLTPV